MRGGFRNLSAYGFLQGAWPCGVVEAIWAGVRKWWQRSKMKTGDADVA